MILEHRSNTRQYRSNISRAARFVKPNASMNESSAGCLANEDTFSPMDALATTWSFRINRVAASCRIEPSAVYEAR